MRGSIRTAAVSLVALFGAATLSIASPSTDPENLLAARLQGPFAPSVRDQLTEMIIQTQLKFFGIDPAEDLPLTRVGLYAAIPSRMPAHGYISSRFGFRRSPFTKRLTRHAGVDIAVRYGSPVYAPSDGTVVYAGWRKALGRLVVIDHGFGIRTKYGHNSHLDVKVGEFVKGGQVIAKAGSSGRSTGSHVHYEVWIKGKVVDPAQFMFPDVPEMDPVMSETYVQIPYSADSYAAMGGDEELLFGPSADLAMGGELTFSDAPEIHASPVNAKTPAYAGVPSVNILSLLVVLFLTLSSGGVVFAAFRR